MSYEAYERIGGAELSLDNRGPAETAHPKAVELSHGQYVPPHFVLGLILRNQRKQFGEGPDEEIRASAGRLKAKTNG